MYGETVAGLAEGVLAEIHREIRRRRVGLLRLEEAAELARMPPDVIAPILRELERRGELVVASVDGCPCVVALPPRTAGPRGRAEEA